MLSVESNRVLETNAIFDFLSFGSYYSKCLLIGLYIAILRNRVREGLERVSKLMMTIIGLIVVGFIWIYYFSLELDQFFLLSCLFPVALQCYNSFKTAELRFTIGYTFIFKIFQFFQILFMANLTAPYSIVPDASHITRPSILIISLVYTVVFAQIVYHPKLFMRWQHLKQMMKFRPIKKTLGELPEKEHGYSCIICMDEFDDENDEGVLTNCEHFFHEKCLEDWIKVKKKCPICKSKCLSVDPEND